ncbi:MAG: hypothetical protein GXO43_05740 [Crenarchaeota archaeon]|nr:hypothetical protein [Thermoproteota archaeon]
MICSELDQIIKEARLNLKRIEKLAFSCLRKLGINPDDWDGKAYLVRRSNGKSEYASLEIYVGWKRKVIGLGRIEKFSKEKLYQVMNRRFGCSPDEVDALLLFRFLKEHYAKLDTAQYHLRRFHEIIEDLNKEFSIDSLIESLKPGEILVWR